MQLKLHKLIFYISLVLTSINKVDNSLIDEVVSLILDVGTDIELHVNKLKQPSIQNARYYNFISAATYCNQTEVLQKWSCRYCFRNESDIRIIKFVSNSFFDTFGFIALDTIRKEIVVAFRGTAGLRNFLEDLDIIQLPIRRYEWDVFVHRGFYLATNSLYNKVLSGVRDLIHKYPKYKVVLTGHSLGGSMAVLTLYMIRSRKHFPKTYFEIYTYGEPRVGNIHFATEVNGWEIPYARVTNYGDIVPHLPPSTFGYIHHQNELWINTPNSTEPKYCSKLVYEDPNCSNSVNEEYSFDYHLHYFGIDLTTSPC